MQSTDATSMAQGGILLQSAIAQKSILTASYPRRKNPPFYSYIVDRDFDTKGVMHYLAHSSLPRHTEYQNITMNDILSKSSLLPHSDHHDMISSSLTPQLNSLSIANTAEQKRCQLRQTAVGRYDLAHVPLEATARQGQGNGAATRVQDIVCNSTDQSKRGSVVNAEVECAGKSGSVSNATDAHHEDAGTLESGYKVNVKAFAVFNISTT